MAGVMEMLKGAAGNIPKAMLEIHKSEKDASNNEEAPKKAAKVLQGGNVGEADKRRFITVQYNPSTLSISAVANNVEFASLQQNGGKGVISQNFRPPQVVMDVELYFDDMQPTDAFMFDKLNASAGSIVSDAAWAVNTVKGNHYTVQPQTHALLATLMSKETRLVTFWWADQRFTGQIVGAQATYTMFSVSGRPIRSRVQLRISQQVETEAGVRYWSERVQTMFKSGEETKAKGLGQTMGNLLNTNNF